MAVDVVKTYENDRLFNMKRKIGFFFEVFIFDDLNDFDDYFIKILEKLSTDLQIIINLCEHETMAENRPIEKICEEKHFFK